VSASGAPTWSPLATIFWARWREGRHLLASVRQESRLKVLFVGISALLLWLGAFVVARWILGGLDGLAIDVLGERGGRELADLILGRLLSVFGASVGVMLVASNVAVVFALLFRSREMLLLMSAPLSGATVFLGRFAEAVWLSSWALAFVGSPFLITYGLVREAGVSYYLALPPFYLLFILIPAALGAMIATGLVLLFAGRRRASTLAIVTVVIAVPLLLRRARIDLPNLFEAEGLQTIAAVLGRAQVAWLPSTWLSRGVLAAADGDWAATLGPFALLATHAALVVWVATVVVDRALPLAWSRLKDQPAGGTSKRWHRGGAANGSTLGLLDRLVDCLVDRLHLPEPGASLLLKDLRVFWRDPSQWTQFLVFFGLIGLYFANARGGALSDPGWSRWIAILNTSATLLILATLTTRFVFPLISLEGRRFWILTLAPISRRSLLRQKFWTSVLATSAITVTMAALSGWRLQLSSVELSLSLFCVAASTVALSGLSVGLGALYPNFDQDSPARIVSGLGGTLNFVLSLLFVAMVAGVQALAVGWRVAAGDDALLPLVLATAIIGGAALLLAVVVLRMGANHLEQVEL
jgi:ABC-2 type transport system permease protein